MSTVSCPQDINLVTSAVRPVVEEVVQKESQHPCQGVRGGEFHDANFHLEQCIETEGHGFHQPSDDLADRTNIHAGERIGRPVDLLTGHTRPD